MTTDEEKLYLANTIIEQMQREIDGLRLQLKAAILEEREACAELANSYRNLDVSPLIIANKIRARKNEAIKG